MARWLLDRPDGTWSSCSAQFHLEEDREHRGGTAALPVESPSSPPRAHAGPIGETDSPIGVRRHGRLDTRISARVGALDQRRVATDACGRVHRGRDMGLVPENEASLACVGDERMEADHAGPTPFMSVQIRWGRARSVSMGDYSIRPRPSISVRPALAIRRRASDRRERSRRS